MIRIATLEDLDAVTAAITTAFRADPLWGPVLSDPAAIWRICAASAIARFSSVQVTGNVAAAAVWIPPGGAELTHDEEEALAAIADPAALEIFELLGKARPTEAHHYLSLLAVHDDHRGRGLGMGLLRACLEQIDAVGGAAYLESSNPAANNRKYEAVGFRALAELTTASGHVVTTMWRDAR